MSFPARPLSSAPACDGMDHLADALRTLWGSLPADALLEKLRGDASTRSYYRVTSAQVQPAALIVMRLPAGGTPAELGVKELPFVDVQRLYAGLAIPVPEIYLDASERGLLLLEDLGDETFEARLAHGDEIQKSELYGQAIDLLVSIHERTAKAGDSIAYTRSFDQKLLRWELEHFREWGLDAIGIALDENERGVLDGAFDALVGELLALPQSLVHRDYQSRNLMWAPRGELVVIDFQDALMGPLGYDLAALLCDSYVEIDEPLQLALVERYANARDLDVEDVVRAFRLVSVQRKLKDAGRFVFIDQVRGNPGFLPWFGRSVEYAARALRHFPAYGAVDEVLRGKLEGYPDRVGTPTARTGTRVAAL